MLSPIDAKGAAERALKNAYTTVFRKVDFQSKFISFGFPRIEYGYKPDGKPVPEAYLARITSQRNAASIISPLQEDIMMSVESHWSPFLPTLTANANQFLQLVTGGNVSAITKATTRRIWTGSSPVRLSLRMNFQAVSDPVVEVTEPLRILGSLALPTEINYASEKTGLPFLGPPGPSPYKLEGLFRKDILGMKEGITKMDSLQGGDKITVEIGQFLTFFNVIVKEVSLTVPIKFDINGNPISAKVSVIFETYEMMTSESFEGSFKNKTVPTERTSSE